MLSTFFLNYFDQFMAHFTRYLVGEKSCPQDSPLEGFSFRERVMIDGAIRVSKPIGDLTSWPKTLMAHIQSSPFFLYF